MRGWRKTIFGDKAVALKHGRLGLAMNNGKVVSFSR